MMAPHDPAKGVAKKPMRKKLRKRKVIKQKWSHQKPRLDILLPFSYNINISLNSIGGI